MRLLLIDTCGDVGSIAVADGSAVIAAEELPARAASSALLPAIHRVLAAAKWGMGDLQSVGVVSGPGSFTGVRVGLAAAKGLCEASALPLAAVSRLEVLGHVAGLESGYAVLDAGRGELFVRRCGVEGNAEEALWTQEQLLAAATGARVAVAESKLMPSLEKLAPELHALSASSCLPLVLRTFAAGHNDAAQIDANYVRSEQQIYGKAAASAGPDRAS